MDDMREPLWFKITDGFRRIKRKINFFIGSRLPDAHIEWDYLQGLPVPICPRCGEYVYYKTQCTRCGQHFLPDAKILGEVLEYGTEH